MDLTITDNISVTNFDSNYLKKYQDISKIHWTPIEIIKLSVEWLSHDGDTNVLDIGSGVGKFCHVGALISGMKFNGVEKREHLYQESVRVMKQLNIKNISFINDNITCIDFTQYNSFYYFNPFCEQVASSDWIDKTTTFSSEKMIYIKSMLLNS